MQLRHEAVSGNTYETVAELTEIVAGLAELLGEHLCEHDLQEILRAHTR